MGLRRCKQYSSNTGGGHQALVSRQIINKVKDAHLNHALHNMRKKEEEKEKKMKQSN